MFFDSLFIKLNFTRPRGTDWKSDSDQKYHEELLKAKYSLRDYKQCGLFKIQRQVRHRLLNQ